MCGFRVARRSRNIAAARRLSERAIRSCSDGSEVVVGIRDEFCICVINRDVQYVGALDDVIVNLGV
jgi:hypothetical protein